MNKHKENVDMGNNPTIKLEPSDYRIAALSPSSSLNVKGEPVDQKNFLAILKSEATDNEVKVAVKKSDDEDVQMEDAPPMDEDAPAPTPPPAPPAFTIYHSVDEIEFTPELALKEGLKMINVIATGIGNLELGPLRKEVWDRDTAGLRAAGVPSTLIAICGGTGAGKSSILNAILDENIVPTSGMRACTAVVTQIAHHDKKTIDADVSFLSEKEWKAELAILLGDLVDEDGSLKRTVDLKSDAGVAWSKVHAVYPTISQEKLITMTPDQIIAKDPKIARILGATKNIVAKDSKSFAAEIGKYIDSKDQKRGKDKDGKKDKDRDHNAPALWPLIRQVNVRCSSPALSTGAILVDLPGTGDANAARNSIAKDYMKKANCIWILAPIHRAVDSKVAKDLLGDAFRTQLMMDGGYDDHTITFIATKCDDISCSEVIQNLRLEEDSELEIIQEKIETIADETSEWKKKKGEADGLVKSIDKELKNLRAIKKEYEDHLEAFKDGNAFIPVLTAKKAKQSALKAVKSKKRKNRRGGKKGSPKRRRSGSFISDDEDELESSDDGASDTASDAGSDSASDAGSDSDSDKSDDEKESDSGAKSDRRKDSDVESVHDEEMEEVTEESLKGEIDATTALITDVRQRLNEARRQRKEAVDALTSLKKKGADVQKEKNAFCAKKRSDFSRDVLKEDFRSGLKDLDDAAAEERDPDNFDPSVNLRDYDAIDLPVFCCSSRDYVRIKKQVKGDGDPTCFVNPEDTGIPAVQQWCHQLTKSSREHASRTFLMQLAAFAKDVKQYVSTTASVTPADRDMLREKWESGEQLIQAEAVPEEDPFAAILGGGRSLYTMPQTVAKVDRFGQPVGITPRLVRDFGEVVESSVSSLKGHLRNGLEDRCRVGAANAADAAVMTAEDFASSMHWASYRATLRRNGEYRRDMNVELVNPFTRNIAQTWQQVFEADVFSSLLSSITDCINKLVNDVERSAAPSLKDRTKLQAESALESARVALNKTVETVKETLTNEQKEVSRSLAPHVKDQLLDGYSRAMAETGTGSVKRQKAVFRSYIVDCKDHIFEDGADVILDKLDGAAEAVGETLKTAMGNLAQKVENNLAVLWETIQDSPKQAAARATLVTDVNQVLEQLQFLTAAAMKAKQANAELAQAITS